MFVGEGLCALPKHLEYKREGTETLPYELSLSLAPTNPDLSLKKQTCLAKAIFSCFCRACLFYFPLINPPLKLLCFFTVPLLFDYREGFIGCANCRKTPLKVLRNRPHKYRRKFAGGGERAGHKD